MTIGKIANRVPTNCSGGGENLFDCTHVRSRLNPRLSFWEQEGDRNILKKVKGEKAAKDPRKENQALIDNRTVFLYFKSRFMSVKFQLETYHQ